MNKKMIISGVIAIFVVILCVMPGVGQSLRYAFYDAITEETAGPKRSALEAYDEVQSGAIVLIDIRRPDEWQKTGIAEGAYPLDMRRDDFEVELQNILDGRDLPVALICARGVRSARMTRRLSEAGFDRIIDIPEGMLGSSAGIGWIKRGLPLTQYEG